MNEEIKTALLVLISPVLFAVLSFFLKRFLNKYEETQTKILTSIQNLETDISSTNTELKLISSDVNRLETTVLNQDKTIEKEVNLRNKRLDRQGDAIVENQKDIAVLKHQIK